MSSTTDESDWNMSSIPKVAPANPHFNSINAARPTIRFSPQRNLTPQHPPRRVLIPRSAPPVQDSHQQTPLVTAPAPQLAGLGSTFTPLPSFSAPVISTAFHFATSTPDVTDQISHGWKAAQESVLDQIVTAPTIATPATVPRGAAKTGGRRGRGGRRAKVKVEKITDDVTNVGMTVMNNAPTVAESGPGKVKGRGRGRGGGRPRGSRAESSLGRGGPLSRGGKRKRGSEDEEEGIKDDTDASETYTPLTQSRSGRKLIKAAIPSPMVIDLEADLAHTTPTSGSKVVPRVNGEKKRKRAYRKSGEASVCKNCGRGHSPAGNVIVFCDGCDTPWHQYCHDRPIPDDVVRVEEMEWFCANCGVLREEKLQLEGRVSAEGMSVVEVCSVFMSRSSPFRPRLVLNRKYFHLITAQQQKRRYLQSLPATHLVSLLLHATTLHPSLPIFSPTLSLPTDLPPPPPSNLPLRVPNFLTDIAPGDEENDLYGPIYSESGPLPYPKSGNGIPLPPESDDIGFLIDDDVVTFSHSWCRPGGDLFGLGALERQIGMVRVR